MVLIENQTIAILDVKKAFEEAKEALEEVINSEEVEKNPGCIHCAYRTYNHCSFVKSSTSYYNPIFGVTKNNVHFNSERDNAEGTCPMFKLKEKNKSLIQKIKSFFRRT